MEKKRKKIEKIMMFIVAKNVVASRPPECRPTGTPQARTNSEKFGNIFKILLDIE